MRQPIKDKPHIAINPYGQWVMQGEMTIPHWNAFVSWAERMGGIKPRIYLPGARDRLRQQC